MCIYLYITSLHKEFEAIHITCRMVKYSFFIIITNKKRMKEIASEYEKQAKGKQDATQKVESNPTQLCLSCKCYSKLPGRQSKIRNLMCDIGLFILEEKTYKLSVDVSIFSN